MIAFAMLAVGAIPASAAGDIKVYIDGKLQSYDQPPVIKNGGTLVPMSGIFKALGAEVLWDNQTRTASGVKGNKIVSLTIDSKTAQIENEGAKTSINLAQPAQIINGRTMVPIRFISESLGAKVDWDGATRTVAISSNVKTTYETITYDDGSVYEGEVSEDGLQHGQGTYKWANGDSYVGSWANGEQHGYGTYTWADGTIYAGNWVNGEMVDNGQSDSSQNNQGSGNVDGTAYANILSDFIPQTTNGVVNLPDASYQALVQNANLFFAKDRKVNSLDGIANTVGYGNIAKNVSKYNSSIVEMDSIVLDDIKEYNVSGETITEAIGHWGGNSVDPVYFQIIYMGSNHLTKGSNTTVSGIPVGETTVTLTNVFGATFTEPMYVVVAGNFYDMLTKAIGPDKLEQAQKEREEAEKKMVFNARYYEDPMSFERTPTLEVQNDGYKTLKIYGIEVGPYKYPSDNTYFEMSAERENYSLPRSSIKLTGWHLGISDKEFEELVNKTSTIKVTTELGSIEVGIE